MEEERRQKTAAIGAKKKIESEYADMEAAVENANKMKEDAQNRYKKIQNTMSQYVTEIEKWRNLRDEALNAINELELKYHILETEMRQQQGVYFIIMNIHKLLKNLL